jgi:flagellar motor switch/type III secretory pathway protein FliN
MTRVRRFPFEQLPVVSRDEISIAARMRQLARTLAEPQTVASALAELSREPVSIRVDRIGPFDVTRIPSEGVGVAFSPASALGMNDALLVDVELALASALVARALRQRAPRVVDTSRPPPPEVTGALGALLHAALRRAHAGVALRVVAAGPARALARDLATHHHRIATAWLTVLLGPDAFEARITVPLSDLPRATGPASLSADALVARGEAPLALPLVLATCLAGSTDIGALRAGDALVLPRSCTQELGVRGGQLVGPVALVAANAERGLAGVLAEGSVLRTEAIKTFSWDASGHIRAGSSVEEQNAVRPMSGESNATLEVLEDAPVVVRVELGSVEMKAREWAALSPGDVLLLGRKLGDPAILRVGGVEIARGELVQVDGEYGVRILAASPSTRGVGET